MNALPEDILMHGLFVHFSSEELLHCKSVCQRWWQVISDIINQKVIMDPKIWEQLGISVENPPTIPKGIYKWLRSPSVFWEGNRGKTGLVVLIPKGVTSSILRKLIEDKFHMRLLPQTVRESNKRRKSKANPEGEAPVENHYWIWISKSLVPGTANKCYAEQEEIVGNPLYDNEKPAYSIVEKSVEVIAAQIVHYFHTKETLLDTCERSEIEGRPGFLAGCSYTRCQSTFTDDTAHVTLGGFPPNGPWDRHTFSDCGSDSDNIGALASRKFLPFE